jgi:hypothetical protein
MGVQFRHNYFLRKNIVVCMQGNHFSIMKNGCAITAQLFSDNEKCLRNSGITPLLFP